MLIISVVVIGITIVWFMIAIKQGQKDHEVFCKQLEDNHIKEKDIKICLCKGQKCSIIYTNDKKLYIIINSGEVIQIKPRDILKIEVKKHCNGDIKTKIPVYNSDGICLGKLIGVSISIMTEDMTYGASQFHVGNLYEEYEKMARLKAILEKEMKEVD